MKSFVFDNDSQLYYEFILRLHYGLCYECSYLRFARCYKTTKVLSPFFNGVLSDVINKLYKNFLIKITFRKSINNILT